VFFLLSLIKTARGLGLLRGFGGFLRDIFKQRGWYEDRRTLQVTASIAHAWTTTAMLGIMPRHACSARCGSTASIRNLAV
jgi:hypothetical protein